MKIPEELLPVVEWWERDGKKTLAIAAVVGVAVLGYISWRSHKEKLQEEAEAAVATAMDVETLQDAVNRFGDYDVGPMLKLKLASAYCARGEEGDAKSALEIYDQVVASGKIPAGFEDVPKVGRAECLESEEDFGGAIAAYESFIASAPTNAPLLIAAKLGLARSKAQSGDRKGAVAYLEAMQKDEGLSASAKARVESTLDVVKRWTKQPAPAPEPPVTKPVTPAPAPAPVAAPKPPAPAPAPVAKPAAPAAPAAKPAAAPAPVKPATPAPVAAPKPPAPAPAPAAKPAAAPAPVKPATPAPVAAPKPPAPAPAPAPKPAAPVNGK